MSRKPTAIRLSKSSEVERSEAIENQPASSEPKPEKKSKTTLKKVTQKPKREKAKVEKPTARTPRVMPAPKLDEASHDPFDQKPFMRSEEMQTVTTHLPDMTSSIRWGGLMLAAVLALFSIGFSLWTVELVEAFFALNPILGWVTLGLAFYLQ